MIDSAGQEQAVIERYSGADNPATNSLFSAVFDLFEENGIAPLILRYNVELNPDYSPDVKEKWYFEGLFQKILEEHFDVPELQSALLIEYCFNIIKTCFLYYRQGRMTREEAIEEIDTAIGFLIMRFQ